MKLYGHVFVATRAFSERNQDLIAFGSLLPEVVFYTTSPVLTYDQIHEVGLELYQFCQNNYPDATDLAIGSMSHNVKYGADRYNSLEILKILGFTEEDIPQIASALEVDIKTARARAHNLYDLVLDHYINDRHPEIRSIVERTKDLDKKLISKILAECFHVSEQNIFENINDLWDKYDLHLVESFEGLAYFWRSLAGCLKEKDPVDIEKTAILLRDFYDRLVDSADGFLLDIIASTKNRVTIAIKQV